MADEEGPPLWQAVVTLSLLVVMLVLMAKEWASPDMIMMATLMLFVPLGIVSIHDAVEGFANTGMLTVAVLIIVAAGIEKTGATQPLGNLLQRFAQQKSGRKPTLPRLLMLICVPIAFLSAFMNNTPVVAMMIPVVQLFAQRIRVSASKLLIPLSYSSIFGGTCTLIGEPSMQHTLGLLAITACSPPSCCRVLNSVLCYYRHVYQFSRAWACASEH